VVVTVAVIAVVTVVVAAETVTNQSAGYGLVSSLS
jgi:hypothetical protein